MRKNNVLLATAIAASLVASMNASYAGLANFPACTTGTSSTVPCNATIAITSLVAATNSLAAFGTNNPAQLIVTINDISKGIIYGTHLFGTTGDNLTLPADPNYADAKWTIEGTPSKEIQLMAILQGASFKTKPILAFEGTSNPLATDPSENCTPSPNPTQCTWRFGNASTSLSNGNAFHILYQLTKAASSLGTHGGEVKMTVKLGTVTSPTIMGEQTITIASSKDPFTVQFKGTDNTYIKVAVSEENKAFVTQMPANLLPDKEFLGTGEVIFGYMYLEPEKDVKIENGYSNWDLGTNAKAGYDANNAILTTLTINEEGQFAASTGNNGSVYLRAGGNNIAAESITATEAIWQLNDAELSSIMKGTTDTEFGSCKSGVHCIPIVIKANGTTAINIPAEEGPKVQFNLDYALATSKKDLAYPPTDVEARLTRYIQDGVSCWVFNVPFPDAIDELNLRIVNDSTITPVGPDCVWGTLYDKSGKEVKAKVSLGCPKKEETLYINSDYIKNLFGITGGGRGIMRITSTLAKMEVLALLRLKSPPCFGNLPGGCTTPNANPLTNLSTGAQGVACAPDYR